MYENVKTLAHERTHELQMKLMYYFIIFDSYKKELN